MSVGKDLDGFFRGEPPGERTNAIRWLQKKVMREAVKLPRAFPDRPRWETYRDRIRRELPGLIGIPTFAPMEPSVRRAEIQVGDGARCERVDVHVDEDYAIPVFVFSPLEGGGGRRPALVWNPGWPQTKYDPAVLALGVRLARRGFVTLALDHAPFGETTPVTDQRGVGMTLVMGMGHVLGWSQLGVRAAETMRCGEYLRSRPDVDPRRVAVAGLCQGGQDTWLSAALDEGFAAAAPICSESTFAIHFAEMASYYANSDSSPFPFGILSLCDIPQLHAAIAPRPLLVRANLGDIWWPVSGFDDVEHLTRQVYALYGREDVVDFRAEVHEHNITGPFADALEAFLIRHLGDRPSP